MSTTSPDPTIITAPDGVLSIDLERVVHAPVEAIWRAYTEPALVAQWLGPIGYTMEVLEYDVRVGGSWNFVHRSPNGDAYEFRGVFHDVQPLESITQTFEFLGAPGHASLEKVRFAPDAEGGTRIMSRSVHLTQEARDGHLAAGMEGGVREGYQRLDDLLETL
ncbi:activator of HSP90 ATPase [Frondihabitans sucicola]|uniref:Activator of HSP90 ATPase n=1 Tax=Frondihabitans sucicola TaxID=1268041 RepID=A0ABN6XYG5_9MICO|nr:SRPBCC family protein [Frondihabitans sucicola]BDZ50077.1 activator of HSP90 ATPase [Frondihabitans sucicola]